MSDYSILAALRHLVFGLERPGQAVRDAVDARLSEFDRLSLIVCAAVPFSISSSKVRDVLDRQLAESSDNELGILIISWCAALLMASAAHYFIGSIFIASVLSVLKVRSWTFVGVRSAWAMAVWIATIPVLLLFFIDSFLPTIWKPAAWYDPLTLAIAGVCATYQMFCVAEITDASLSQAFVAAIAAALGLYFLAGFLSDGINILSASV